MTDRSGLRARATTWKNGIPDRVPLRGIGARERSVSAVVVTATEKG
ncbi:MAG: hypothetical protein IPI13_10295 [Actinomycetales bacterium]|uniref:Uncharacterized protein n=1 Tax=Candidatus Phosphoribacter hodrii TaxID=2953743 RepID=A0A935ILT1_9MICO|nr:hypothetical protein [Candidatus Phosphoribacter hodrii]MBK7273526.1 hypothetical protein [Candidatus Phosphoribacter hodrii]MBL0003526.1 hypothetical protein [Candidatus Phosphoribacter hodrii]